VSKALLFRISHSFPYIRPGCGNVQLHAESGAEDGEQHGGVAAENRAAVEGQSGSVEGYA
jgi:hypothetical protein